MRKTSAIVAPALAFGLVLGATSLSANAETVTIEEGDTFYGIAQEQEGITANKLQELNSNLNPYALPIGTEIQLSAVDSSGDTVTHVIQPGNTLFGIASVYDGVTVDDLYDLNEGLDPYNLTIGSELTVVERENSTGEGNVVNHTVQPGNTLNEIASVYDYVTVDDIKAANPDVDPYSLSIGSQIVIPLD